MKLFVYAEAGAMSKTEKKIKGAGVSGVLIPKPAKGTTNKWTGRTSGRVATTGKNGKR